MNKIKLKIVVATIALIFVGFTASSRIMESDGDCIVVVECGDGEVRCSGEECSSSTSGGGSVTCDGKKTSC